MFLLHKWDILKIKVRFNAIKVCVEIRVLRALTRDQSEKRFRKAVDQECDIRSDDQLSQK